MMHPFDLPRRSWKKVPWLLAAHVAFLAGIHMQHGILLDKEALKYTGCALDVLNGDLSDLLGAYRAYSAYILFLVPFMAVGIPTAAVFTQVVLGVVAAFTLRGIVRDLGGPDRQADLAFGAFLLLYPIQTWVLSLYSESFFVPLSVLFFGAAFRPGARPWRIAALAMIVLFARPVGVLFVVPTLLWAVARRCSLPPLPWVRGSVVVSILAFLFLPVLNSAILRVVIESHGIGGIPAYPGAGATFQGSTLAGAVVQVITEHGPGAYLGHVLERIAWLLLAARPHFSMVHNALMVPVILLYPFACIAVRRHWHDPRVQVLSAVVLLNVVVVGLTFAEWNGRFLVPMLPPIIVLAALGIRSPEHGRRG